MELLWIAGMPPVFVIFLVLGIVFQLVWNGHLQINLGFLARVGIASICWPAFVPIVLFYGLFKLLQRIFDR